MSRLRQHEIVFNRVTTQWTRTPRLAWGALALVFCGCATTRFDFSAAPTGTTNRSFDEAVAPSTTTFRGQSNAAASRPGDRKSFVDSGEGTAAGMRAKDVAPGAAAPAPAATSTAPANPAFLPMDSGGAASDVATLGTADAGEETNGVSEGTGAASLFAPTFFQAMQGMGQGTAPGSGDSNLAPDSNRFPLAFPELGQGMAERAGGINVPSSSRFPLAFPEATPGAVEAAPPTWYSIHAQGTTITQKNNVFPSPYVGPNSFLPGGHQATSETATLFIAARLWEGTEIVFNPEVAGGAGLSNVFGIAGFPNGEMTKVGAAEPTPYLARLYVRQTWGLGGGQEQITEGPNTVAGTVDVDRVVVVAGLMALPDLFDDNRYSNNPRAQFMNWTLMLNGAWDYAADTRGYVYAGGITLYRAKWALRYALAAMPTVANGFNFDPKLLLANSHNLEYQRIFTMNERPGHLHFLAYLNNANMGSYSESLAQMPVDPDITATRAYRSKYGFGASVDLELADDVGVFSRLGWNNGQTESFVFTEVDRTASLGFVFQGTRWGRKNDLIGLAGVINGISGVHAAYLAAGGLGFQLGDGKLNYGYEEILETYYRLQIRSGIHMTADFQGINNPGYNRDRGPVAVGSVRFHFEF